MLCHVPDETTSFLTIGGVSVVLPTKQKTVPGYVANHLMVVCAKLLPQHAQLRLGETIEKGLNLLLDHHPVFVGSDSDRLLWIERFLDLQLLDRGSDVLSHVIIHLLRVLVEA